MENSGVQPGQTITPGSASGSAPDPQPPQPANPPAPQPATAPEQPPAPELASAPKTPPVPAPNDQPPAVPTGLEQPPDDSAGYGDGSDGEISWTASEFIAHEKNAGWYLGLAMAAAVMAGLIYLITRDFVSVGVVVFGALMLGVYGARQPRQLEYRIDPAGVMIGQKYYPFSDFRTFSVIPEGAFSSIVFMPLKRFSPPTTIYYDPKDEDNIINILSGSLPFEEGKHDPVDRLMRRIRF